MKKKQTLEELREILVYGACWKPEKGSPAAVAVEHCRALYKEIARKPFRITKREKKDFDAQMELGKPRISEALKETKATVAALKKERA